MTGNGIMEEIRTLLAQGKSSGQVIALGYKPPTVYKVLHQVKRNGEGNGRVSAPGVAQPPATSATDQSRPDLEAENPRLKREVESLEAQLEFVEDDATTTAAELRTLQEKVKALEPEGAAAGQLRQRVKDLEAQLEAASLTQVTMRQDSDQWRQKFAAEQAARQKAEGQTVTLRQDNQRLQGELAQWQQWEPRVRQVCETMHAEMTGLRPLAVWAGHPCQVCKQPMQGSVNRETAAKLMQGFGHQACLEKQGPGLGWLLAGGAALVGLSQLGKS
jgi:RNA-binding protein YhbY